MIVLNQTYLRASRPTWSQYPRRNAGWISQISERVRVNRRAFDSVWCDMIESLPAFQANTRTIDNRDLRAVTEHIQFFPLEGRIRQREERTTGSFHVTTEEAVVHVLFAINYSLTAQCWSAFDFLDVDDSLDRYGVRQTWFSYGRAVLTISTTLWNSLVWHLSHNIHTVIGRHSFWDQIFVLTTTSYGIQQWPHVYPDPPIVSRPRRPRSDSLDRFIEDLSRDSTRMDQLISGLSREYAARGLGDGTHVDRTQIMLMLGRNNISPAALADIYQIVLHDVNGDGVETAIEDGQ